ncbi:hypothetical protein AX14_009373, partial [Amanita brunnescens Koide BX004]
VKPSQTALFHSTLTITSTLSHPTEFPARTSTIPEHLKRVAQVYESSSKKRYVRGAFNAILPKNAQVSKKTPFLRLTSITREDSSRMRFLLIVAQLRILVGWILIK